MVFTLKLFLWNLSTSLSESLLLLYMNNYQDKYPIQKVMGYDYPLDYSQRILNITKAKLIL